MLINLFKAQKMVPNHSLLSAAIVGSFKEVCALEKVLSALDILKPKWIIHWPSERRLSKSVLSK